MDSKTLLSISVDEDLVKRLDKFASVMDRSRSYVAVEAIEEYLDLHEWQIQGIRLGLKDIEKQNLVNFEDVKSEFI